MKENYFQSPKPWDYVLNRRETFEALPINKGKIMFVGDSITQRNEWAEMFNNYNIINRGIDSDRIIWLHERLDNLIANEPSKIFLKIGINDIMDGKPVEQMIEEYEFVLDKFKEINNCEILVQSCLPVNNTEYKHPIDNTRVQMFNSNLRELVQGKGLKYINLYDSFVDERNELNPRYTKDGCHLNGNGYLVWKGVIDKLSLI